MRTATELGRRICVLGPSNSGKSTLAIALGERLGLPVVHLDLLFHKPDTDWEPRPLAEFVVAHDETIARDSWVIEGNYSIGIPQRLDRATSVIWLHGATLPRLFRYVRRTLFESTRAGHIQGGRDSLKWNMIHHIAIINPRNQRTYGAMLAERDLPIVRILSMRELNRIYETWDLRRP
jgi:adenylate kinase family enzyme